MKHSRFPYGMIYGPHMSRRFGWSLGIDLTPMACTFNCVYCERGPTVVECRGQTGFSHEIEIECFLDILKRRLKTVRKFDSITFSGTGEPTLEPRLGVFIDAAKTLVGNTPIRVITNSSLLTSKEVIQNLEKADEVVAKLNTVSDHKFRAIHRPYDETMDPKQIIRGINNLQQALINRVYVEILFIRSSQSTYTNATDEELRKISRVLKDLTPHAIQLHTLRRTPSELGVYSVNRQFLQKASSYLKHCLTRSKILTYF